MTSQPLLRSGVGRLGFLDRVGPVVREDDVDRHLRIDALGPEGISVDVAEDLRDPLGRDEAELFRLAGVGGDHAREILRLVDEAEVAADVLRVLVGAPEAAAVEEHDVRILLGHLEDVRIEVAERGREDELRPVGVDHADHRLLDVDVLRYLLLLVDLDAGDLLDRGGAFGVGLVVAVVVLRADVDEAHGDGLAGVAALAAAGDADQTGRQRHGEQGRAQEPQGDGVEPRVHRCPFTLRGVTLSLRRRALRGRKPISVR